MLQVHLSRSLVLLKLLVLVAAFAFGTVQAQSAPTSEATVEELLERLAPAPGAITRGLRNLVPESRAIDLNVEFEYDSAKLKLSGIKLLDNMAQAIGHERLSNVQFVIEGHTDAAGSAAYNNRLSLQRAQSVAAYLKSRGVSTDRMEVVGKGFSELLYPDRPRAGENRRVRIVAKH